MFLGGGEWKRIGNVCTVYCLSEVFFFFVHFGRLL